MLKLGSLDHVVAVVIFNCGKITAPVIAKIIFGHKAMYSQLSNNDKKLILCRENHLYQWRIVSQIVQSILQNVQKWFLLLKNLVNTLIHVVNVLLRSICNPSK